MLARASREQPGQLDRLVQGDEDLLRQLRGLLGTTAGHQHGELAVADPYHRMSGVDRLHQARGDCQQKSIALQVAEGLVDLLDAPDLQLQNAERMALLPGGGNRLLKQLAQAYAVWQAGEGVSVGHAADGRLGLGGAGTGAQGGDAETQVVGSLRKQFNLLVTEGIGFGGVDTDGAEDLIVDP